VPEISAEQKPAAGQTRRTRPRKSGRRLGFIWTAAGNGPILLIRAPLNDSAACVTAPFSHSMGAGQIQWFERVALDRQIQISVKQTAVGGGGRITRMQRGRVRRGLGAWRRLKCSRSIIQGHSRVIIRLKKSYRPFYCILKVHISHALSTEYCTHTNIS